MDIDWKGIRFDGEKKYRRGSCPTRIDPLYRDKQDYQKRIRKLRGAIDERQQIMYAHNRYSLLTVFQALDAAGKDGTIRAVFNGVNPHGVEITSFKHPTSAELEHNFLWRTSIVMPKRGNIGVFNRSYYEEVLVCRVHPELVTKYQKIPGEHTRDLDALFASRFEAIRSLERYNSDNGTVTLKFFLNLSRGEQRKRFLSRIDEPEKNWKFSEADLKERGFWDDYQRAFEHMINETATPHAPWYVVPADDKKNMRLIVASAVLKALNEMNMCYPTVSKARRKLLREYRKQLLKD